MKTDPFTDSFLFLIGESSDLLPFGPWRWLLVVLFIGLLAGSVWAAWNCWQEDPDQLRGRDIWAWIFRVLLGTMWFQGSLWKLPLPVSGGLQYWTEQMTQYAAFPFISDLVRVIALPHLALLDPLVFLLEMGLATSFLLGLFVRPMASLGALYSLGLWIALYKHPTEWPWEYIFLAIAQGQLAVYSAGHSLGFDRLIANNRTLRAIRG